MIACKALGLNYDAMSMIIEKTSRISKASAAMFKLNIVRKALNLGQDLHLTKDPKGTNIYYPYNSFITRSSTYYKSEIDSGLMEVIGKIKSEGEEYYIIGGRVNYNGNAGLGGFSHSYGLGGTTATGLLGCVSKDIALHFSKYFGMLITEAKYGDMVDFEIVEDKYGNV